MLIKNQKIDRPYLHGWKEISQFLGVPFWRNVRYWHAYVLRMPILKRGKSKHARISIEPEIATAWYRALCLRNDKK
jgi:hypothetical protein